MTTTHAPRRAPANPAEAAVEVPISRKDVVAIVDAADYSLVSQHRWNGSFKEGRWYVYTRIPTGGVPRQRTVGMHRLIMGATPGRLVDHVNGDPLDNRRSNLRFCTNAENQWNRHARQGMTPYKGVYRPAGRARWRAGITYRGERIYLGTFADLVEAARAYDAAAVRLFGPFANCNFPSARAS